MEIKSYFVFRSQDERHDLNFTIEHLYLPTVMEDSLCLIFDSSNKDCKVKGHPKTLKMLLENNINILINAKIRLDEQTIIKINMNLDEIPRDCTININLKIKLNLDEIGRASCRERV